MLILVCGDRNWTSRERIRARLELFGKGTIVLHGAARGADTIAGEVANELGFRVVAVPAEWSRHGRSAGPIRNRLMLDLNPGLVLYAHDDLGASRGTADCVREARRRGIPVDRIP